MNQTCGDVPKWLKGADSKSARRRKACGGSNPSISAKNPDTPFGVPGFYRDGIDTKLLFPYARITIKSLHLYKRKCTESNDMLSFVALRVCTRVGRYVKT